MRKLKSLLDYFLLSVGVLDKWNLYEILKCSKCVCGASHCLKVWQKFTYFSLLYMTIYCYELMTARRWSD